MNNFTGWFVDDFMVTVDAEAIFDQDFSRAIVDLKDPSNTLYQSVTLGPGSNVVAVAGIAT